VSSINGLYVAHHESQYQAGASLRTRTSGCTWTSFSTGADASTGGGVNKTPDQVLALVLPSEETNPQTPGWSLDDAKLAADRLHVPFENRSGEGWSGVEDASDAGLYVILQGDSDQFGNATCSGAFDGDHCIGVHPARRTYVGVIQAWIDDPICPLGRWEALSVLRRYAEKFSPTVRFGVLTKPVPHVRFRVSISGYTPLYSSPGGAKVGAVRLATYICTRSKVDGLWWYKIVSLVGGGATKNAGRFFKPNRNTEAHPI